MSEPDKSKTSAPNPEEIRSNRKQVWLTLIVMLGSSCVGILLLTGLLWFLFKKVIPPGWF